MALNLDLEKAYDMLDWSIISACLGKFGFADDWINLVLNCISSVSFSLLITSRPECHFKPSRDQTGRSSLLIFSFFAWNPLLEI